MAKHTSGPWTVGNRNNIVTDIAAPNYTKAVAKVWTHKQDPGNPKILTPDPEGLANAALIAAAPELLAALESIVKEHTGPVDEYTMGRLGLALVEAQNAITKATAEAGSLETASPTA